MMAKLVGAMAFLSPVLGFSRLPSTLFVGRRVSVSSMASRADEIAKNLADNGLVLPPPGAPKANYNLVSRDGDLLYVSGHLPAVQGADLILGKLAPEGKDGLSIEEGYEAAKWCALNMVSTIERELDGDLGKVVKVIKLFGIVAGTEDFQNQHLVMNGASDTMGQVFGKEVGGVHARSAIGTNSLPLGVPVEVEAVVRVAP
eukprot:CAMPEP_0172596594 /NCGR_PEP_ID=MMETSP1068-20121228/16431_1 /TAXON_ID=35684 /ORGANISM="Pseudopedinella elastica, Strain CCMP716" /LENGTH=200 /DNA_ID=CAMNT_0013395721 /DNA_START=15 /DNA_END=617 /DNA_ORIENTATION=-